MQDLLQRRSLDMFRRIDSGAAFSMKHSTNSQKENKKNRSEGKELDFSELLNKRMEEIAIRV